MKIAAIDIGTNSIHMVIARATGGAGFEIEDREREVVQVGRGSFRAGRLKAGAIRRTVEALGRFVDLARRQQVDRLLCTSTAAVREARNGGGFVQAARTATGIVPRIIPAEEEGRLICLGVKSALQLDAEPWLIVDIGGGSMQLVVADRARLLETHSVPLGALRLAETFPGSDPPSRRDLQRLRRHIRRVAAAALRAVSERGVVRVVGSSGSIHALAQLAHQEDAGSPIAHINGYELRLGALERVSRRLQRLPLSSIERLPGLDARRAEIILPGALVLTHVLKAVGAESIVMSDFGVREGLVTDYLTSHAGEISALGNVEDLRLRSVLQLLQKYQPDERQMRHARHVARLSLALFDGLRRTHGLEPDAREVLHFAALLHDVGALVGYDGHADHSYYLIKHGNLRGVSAEELETIAVVARYHGKNRPRKRDQAFRAMRKRDRRMVRWLAAILQIAEGLDRSHYQLVQGLRVVRRGDRLSILIATRRSAGLELWAARRRTRLLEKLIRARVRVAPDPALDAGRERAAPARARSETKPARAKVLPLRVRPGGF